MHRRADVDADHVRHFLDCVKSRQDPIEPVETGHSTGSLCILGNIANPALEPPARNRPPPLDAAQPVA